MRGLLLLASVLGVACRPHAASASSGGLALVSSADSARGTLSLVGNEPLSVLLLTPTVGESREALALRDASAADALRHVVGLEIVVFGKRTNARAAASAPRGAPIFDVQRFVVRSADGILVTDGVIVATASDKFALRLFDGQEVPVAALPSSLRRLIGARVWLAGPLSSPPQSYGVIREPR